MQQSWGDWSISTKISIVSGGVVLVLLSLIGLVSFQLQSQMIQQINEARFQDSLRALEERETALLENLKSTVAFNAKNVSRSGAQYVYNVESDGIRHLIEPYLEMPEMLAIEVIDGDNQPFAAVWRDGNDIQFVNEETPNLPSSHLHQLIEFDSEWEGEPMGKVRFIYTEAPVREKTIQLKQAILKHAAEEEEQIRRYFWDSSLKQGVGLMLAVVVLAFSIVLLMRKVVLRPLDQLIAIINDMDEGRISRRVEIHHSDEIGRMGKAINRFADDLQSGAVQALQQMAQGDLTFEVTPKSQEDVMGVALQTTSHNLNATVARLYQAGEQVAQSAIQISDSSQSISKGATDQAASLQQLSASTKMLTKQVHASASHASEAGNMTQNVHSQAEQGNTQMQHMLEAMDQINSASNNISRIIKDIDELAFQTNLLALNAAVEAARAGDHGKGFAVVAREVRSLASRSAEAAKKTAELIETSIEKVESGSHTAKETASALDAIVQSIDKVSSIVSEIVHESQEQVQGIQEINQGLGQINEVTQQNAMEAINGANASAELSTQAQQLKQLVSQFKIRNSDRLSGLPSESMRLLSGPGSPSPTPSPIHD